jgi:hypothetical protein
MTTKYVELYTIPSFFPFFSFRPNPRSLHLPSSFHVCTRAADSECTTNLTISRLFCISVKILFHFLLFSLISRGHSPGCTLTLRYPDYVLFDVLPTYCTTRVPASSFRDEGWVGVVGPCVRELLSQ